MNDIHVSIPEMVRLIDTSRSFAHGTGDVSIPEMVRLIGLQNLSPRTVTTCFNSRDGAIDRYAVRLLYSGTEEFQFQRWCD